MEVEKRKKKENKKGKEHKMEPLVNYEILEKI